MRNGLVRWADWIRGGATEREFVSAARRELDPAVAETIETTAPFEPSYVGLKRYWESKRRPFGVGEGRAS